MNNYPNDPQQPNQQPTTNPYPSNPGYPPQQPMQPYPQSPSGPMQQGYPQQGYPQPPMQPGYPQMPPQQPIQPRKKKKGLWIALGIIIGAVVLCGVIATNSGGKTSTTTTSSNTNDNSSSQQQAPDKPKTWQTTHTYSGNGDQQTETFTVGDDWKIQWDCKSTAAMDAPLYVSIYDADTKSMTDWSAVSTSCKPTSTTGETVEHGGGNLYLKIISGIDWKITIQELK